MNHIKLVKRIFKDNFLRDLSDDEAENLVDKMISQTREDFSKTEGFTEEKFQKYLSGNLILAFSPNSVFAEVKRVVDEIGIEVLEKSSKYKVLSEINNACCLALAMNKLFKERWAIKAQDFPDIVLTRVNSGAFSEKHVDAVLVEIMEIPEFAREELGKDIELGIAEFIKAKKFIKRYEKTTHLLVHLNIQQTGLSLKRISEILCSDSGNPFYQIWCRANADPVSQVMNICLLTPEFRQTQIDFVNDREMFF